MTTLLTSIAPYALRALRADRDRLQRDVARASEARRALEAGSTRAKVTTANARWSIKADALAEVERLISDIEHAQKGGGA